jgi:hypothetical protein
MQSAGKIFFLLRAIFLQAAKRCPIFVNKTFSLIDFQYAVQVSCLFIGDVSL